MLSSIRRGAAWAVVGAVVTLLATIWHRWSLPLGFSLGLVAVIGVAVAARAVSGPVGAVGAAVGALLAAQAAALRGPGGDILVQGDAVGLFWITAAPVLALLVVVLPRAWFAGPAERGERSTGRTGKPPTTGSAGGAAERDGQPPATGSAGGAAGQAPEPLTGPARRADGRPGSARLQPQPEPAEPESPTAE
ncbi:MAG: hypothetical protein LBJ62_09590 [Bifidobacteriaceae bacterium]|nr:hypothetical protein [Bifidobacteriaceae bacterium]